MEKSERATGTVGRSPRWIRWAMAAMLAVTLASFILWLVLVVPQLLVPAESDASLRDVADPGKRHELEGSRLKLQNDVRTTLLQGLGGLAVVVGVFFTYRQVQTGRRHLEHTVESSRQLYELGRQGQVTERFTQAIDQLGHENGDVRLGGIYALERIARDSPEDRSAITEVLTAFVRGHAPWPPTRPWQPTMEQDIEKADPLRGWAPEVQAALTVIGRRPPEVGLYQRLNLSGTDLRRADLRNARLEQADLSGARLLWGELEGVHLQDADLSSADLAGADLVGAQLERAHFDSAELQSADLGDANLRGAILRDAGLDHARLRGTQMQAADLSGAWLGSADLAGANLQGATLRRAHLGGADLRDVELQGARCDAETTWPEGFDWKVAGILLEEH